ncbi:hypothetical protein D3C87_1741410 [compost metagenome]
MRQSHFGIGAHGVDCLEAKLDRAGLGRLHRGFYGLRGFLGGRFHLGIGFLGLGSTLLGEVAETFRHLRRVHSGKGKYIIGVHGGHLELLASLGDFHKRPWCFR